MKLFMAIAALALSSTAHAGISPTSPPEGIRVEIVDRDTCVNVNHALGNEMRNLFAIRNIAGESWLKNSKGEYLAFNCWYMPHLHDSKLNNTDQNLGIIFITDKSTLKAIMNKEISEAQRELEEKQQRIKQSRYY